MTIKNDLEQEIPVITPLGTGKVTKKINVEEFFLNIFLRKILFIVRAHRIHLSFDWGGRIYYLFCQNCQHGDDLNFANGPG